LSRGYTTTAVPMLATIRSSSRRATKRARRAHAGVPVHEVVGPLADDLGVADRVCLGERVGRVCPGRASDRLSAELCASVVAVRYVFLEPVDVGSSDEAALVGVPGEERDRLVPYPVVGLDRKRGVAQVVDPR
jgi:hypothetical protein